MDVFTPNSLFILLSVFPWQVRCNCEAVIDTDICLSTRTRVAVCVGGWKCVCVVVCVFWGGIRACLFGRRIRLGLSIEIISIDVFHVAGGGLNCFEARINYGKLLNIHNLWLAISE